MATFTNFALLGVGNVGGVIADELLKKNLKVTILTRDASKAELQEFKNRGAVLATIDYADRVSITKALAGVEVVVSAVGGAGLAAQIEVIQAAKEAGVQLFVPAEYGLKVVDGPLIGKKAVRDALKEANLPYTLFFTTLFYEFVPFLFELNAEAGTIRVVGDGKATFTLGARSEVARVIAHIVSTAPKTSLEWAEIPIEGERLSQLDVVAINEKKLGKKLTINYVDYEENKKGHLTDFKGFLTTVIADGRGVSGTEEEVAEAKAKFFSESALTSYETFLA